MKIIMELLAIQSEGSRNRGIGRYSEELTKALLTLLKNSEIKLYLSDLYPEFDKTIKTYFKNLVNQDHIIKYQTIDLTNKNFLQRNQYRELNTYLFSLQANKQQSDIVHLHSLFEGMEGKAGAIKNFNFLNAKTVVTLYDLIPLIFKNIYLQTEDVKKFYFQTLLSFYHADYIVAISEATKEDAINILGIPAEKIINISGSIDKKKFFKRENIPEKEKILSKFSIEKSFIMYTGGIDFRKNIDASIEAFANLEETLLQQYQFVIVCKITNSEKERLLRLARENNLKENAIVFTNFVSDEELNALYNLTTLFIFPSIYEGFGLPVLEAMTCAKAVIGSDTSSIPEVIGRKDCLFNPNNIPSITNTIEKILQDEKYRKELENYFFNRAKEFSWENSAKKVIQIYQKLKKEKKRKIIRKKIAFFSPLPPMKSGISDYSLDLLPFLLKYCDIDIFIDDYEVQADFIKYNCNIYNYRLFEDMYEQYDEIIYQFGNSEFHAYMYDIALKYSGIIVLHDFFLSGLVNYIAHTTNENELFLDTLIYAHAAKGKEAKKNLLASKVTLTDCIKKFPVNKQVLDSAKAVIMHSQYAIDLIEKYYNNSYNTVKINQLINLPSEQLLQKKEYYKEKLNLKDSLIISAFGHIGETKQYDFILKSMIKEKFFEKYNIKLLFVGEFSDPLYKRKILSIIKKYALAQQVVITGFVSDKSYKEYLLATDIAINLRKDSRGETSRALLMNMAYALPTIINDYATFSEFPSNTVAKIILFSQKSFNDTLEKLISDNTYRKQIAKNAYYYIKENHNILDIAQQYYETIRGVGGSADNFEKNSIKEIAKIIVENNLENISKSEYKKTAKILKKTVSC